VFIGRSHKKNQARVSQGRITLLPGIVSVSSAEVSNSFKPYTKSVDHRFGIKTERWIAATMEDNTFKCPGLAQSQAVSATRPGMVAIDFC
jgi:hypothetical protein